MSLQLFFFALLVVVPLSAAHIGGQLPSLQDLSTQRQVYCGRELARMIAYMCDKYPNTDKRTDYGTMYGAILSPYKEQEMQLGWPWITAYKARGLETHRGKRYSGVVSECCDKACSVYELLTYC